MSSSSISSLLRASSVSRFSSGLGIGLAVCPFEVMEEVGGCEEGRGGGNGIAEEFAGLVSGLGGGGGGGGEAVLVVAFPVVELLPAYCFSRLVYAR